MVTQYCENCREELDMEFAFGELHYTDFESQEAFEALTERHGLEYIGDSPEDGPGATRHLWAATDGLSLWTAKDPTKERMREVMTAEGTEPRDATGYASYLFVDGPAGAAEMLYRDVIETAGYIKGEFKPLQTRDGEEIVSYWEVSDS